MQKINPDKIRCGLIGIGRWGKNYLRLLQDIDGAALHATVSHSNVSSTFSDPEIDAVFIVTPPSTHYALIKAGLEADKHVFTEKPMVLNMVDANKLKTLAKQSDKVFMVGYQYLFNNSVRTIKKEIEKGTFGKILSVKSEYVLSPARPDIDIFWDAGPHPLSVFQYLFHPEKLVCAEGEIEHDSASIKVHFENAPALEITASCLGKTKVRKLSVIGEKATAILDETLKKNKLAITKNGKTFYPAVGSQEPLKTELEHFLHCIQTSSTPLTDINFGCKITEWLEIISKRLESSK